MKTFKVLGSGCSKCQKTAASIEQIAAELGIEVRVIKETDPMVIMQYGVMSTPAVVADEQLVHSGSVPQRAEIEGWLSA
ncbi:thioredoxin family protein [Marinobacterium sedimentorum]|uniref:thioredoxin family protein n=1 Tax=Marinobacterium sedimentorum TaxID=2927804 RepID=UPI0020C6939E|nr:thioredoxin family protein [Marinobacterium sedimentorum]MCP8687342.1 thioredoxin family protein [Marinobacterium sedimentorum]